MARREQRLALGGKRLGSGSLGGKGKLLGRRGKTGGSEGVGGKTQANKGTELKVGDNRTQCVQLWSMIADARWESMWQNEPATKQQNRPNLCTRKIPYRSAWKQPLRINDKLLSLKCFTIGDQEPVMGGLIGLKDL